MATERVPFYTVDAFTDTPFDGNPAAVCLDIDKLPESAMMAIAREMNLSETAFIYEPDDEGLRRLRWFTPAVEVPLCGHATLASAHVLVRELGAPGPIRFKSASGPLTVHEDGVNTLRMDFPADPPKDHPAPEPLWSALGIEPGSGRYLTARNLGVLVLADADAVMGLRPDFGALGRVDLGDVMGLAVTAEGDGEVDFVSRFYAPWKGVDEDPVTGSAHTALTPFWAGELGKDELRAHQGLDRGGTLTVRTRGDRVDLIGHAVTVAYGKLLRPM